MNIFRILIENFRMRLSNLVQIGEKFFGPSSCFDGALSTSIRLICDNKSNPPTTLPNLLSSENGTQKYKLSCTDAVAELKQKCTNCYYFIFQY